MARLSLLILIAGWAVAGGAVATAQQYTDPLEPSEQVAMSETLQYALENNRSHEPVAWVNPDTHRSGTVVPVHTYQNTAGQYCREFITTIVIAGMEEQAYGTACRQADGSWLIVSQGSVSDYPQVVERIYCSGDKTVK